jgi:hypothetical protein
VSCWKGILHNVVCPVNSINLYGIVAIFLLPSTELTVQSADSSIEAPMQSAPLFENTAHETRVNSKVAYTLLIILLLFLSHFVPQS